LAGEGQTPDRGRRKRQTKILYVLTAESAKNAEMKNDPKDKKERAKILFIGLILN
jgi:hypothetical protein